MSQHMTARDDLMHSRWERKSDRSVWRVYQIHRPDRSVLLEPVIDCAGRADMREIPMRTLKAKYRDLSR
jgi:hypothetical protein